MFNLFGKNTRMMVIDILTLRFVGLIVKLLDVESPKPGITANHQSSFPLHLAVPAYHIRTELDH